MSDRSARELTAPAALLWLAASFVGFASAQELIVDPREFGRAPRMTFASLSADGATLGFVEQSANRQIIVLRDLESNVSRRTLQLDPRRERARWCEWAGSDHLLCGTVTPVRAPDGVFEKTNLYSIARSDGHVRELNLRLKDPVRDRIVDLSAGSFRVLLQHDPIGLGYPEVAELNVANGALRRLISAHPPVRHWMSAGDGRIALGIGYDGTAATLHVRDEDGGWKVLVEQTLADLDAIGPLEMGTERDLYAIKHHDGRAALFHFDLREPRLTAKLLFADPVYDVAGPIALDPQTRELLSVRYARHRDEVHVFDELESRRRDRLAAQLPNTVNLIVGRSRNGMRWLVRSFSDTDPPSLYLYDVDQQNVVLLAHEYPQLEGYELARMSPVSYQARDGQTIPAYLTLPVNREVRELATIILPHGGPETRTIQRFDPLVQFLAAQGYAVLQMNFRGSLGYGAGFAAAGVGQWGGVIHNDITDGTRWLVDRGIADPTRICIAGLSFGGYAALLGAAREAQWYACAASFAGVADLMAYSQYTERLGDAELWRQRLGSDSLGLWQMSPMARVHAIETPILMMHGRLDSVVPISQTRRFARTLSKAGKPYRLIERSDCDHEMTVESCRIAWFTALQSFLRSTFEGGNPP